MRSLKKCRWKRRSDRAASVRRFLSDAWARDHLKTGCSLHDAANALATSTRSLQRRCQEVLGKSPLAYFQGLRVEHAQSLLHGSGFGRLSIAMRQPPSRITQ